MLCVSCISIAGLAYAKKIYSEYLASSCSSELRRNGMKLGTSYLFVCINEVRRSKALVRVFSQVI